MCANAVARPEARSALRGKGFCAFHSDLRFERPDDKCQNLGRSQVRKPWQRCEELNRTSAKGCLG